MPRYQERQSFWKDKGGMPPADWSLLRLKWVLSSVESGKRESGNADEPLSGALSIGGEHIGRDGHLMLSNPRYISVEIFTSMKSGRVRERDVLMVKDGATIGKAAIVNEMPCDLMAVNEHVFVLRPRKDILPEFLFFLVSSTTTQQQIWAHVQGAAQPGLSSDFTAAVWVVVPPEREQRRVVSYLTAKISDIDTLIASKLTQIELLQEKRAALITHAVTKGLNPNARMKDSGVEWLGQIPEHWRINRAKAVFKQIDERSSTGEEELLTVSHITGVTPRSEKTVNMFMAESLEGYKKCQPGDLVINTMWAWMGAMGITMKAGIVSPSYNVYRFRTCDGEPHFYDHLVHTGKFISEVTRHSQGVWTSRLRLYPEEFFQVRIPCPPLPEQLEIVNFIQRETGNYNLFKNEIERSVETLREYRAALISAAITGKIDVREEVD